MYNHLINIFTESQYETLILWNHIIDWIFMVVTLIMLLWSLKKTNGWTLGVIFLFATGVFNTTWSILFIYGLFDPRIEGLFWRDVTGTLRTLALVYMFILVLKTLMEKKNNANI